MAWKNIKDSADAVLLGVLPESTAEPEIVGSLTGTAPTFDPDAAAVGSIVTWTLTGNSTPVDALTSGQSMTLHLTAGSYSVTWPTSTVIGTWPSGLATGLNVIVLWKVGTTLYRTYAGAVA